MMSDKFYHDKPRCHGKEIQDKIAYNSSCIRDISEMLATNRGFSGTGYQMMSVKFRGVNLTGDRGDTSRPPTGGTRPPKFALGDINCIVPQKLSEDTGRVGHTWDMSHYFQH